MQYTVTWHPDAESELARLWLNASDRDALSRAANEIDVALATAPEHAGQEFYGDRLLVVAP